MTDGASLSSGLCAFSCASAGSWPFLLAVAAGMLDVEADNGGVCVACCIGLQPLV